MQYNESKNSKCSLTWIGKPKKGAQEHVRKFEKFRYAKNYYFCNIFQFPFDVFFACLFYSVSFCCLPRFRFDFLSYFFS